MTINPPKYKINQQALSDFSATITAKPNLTKEEIFQKFPEFNNDADLLQSAMDYHETSKSGKYKDITELNSKFPEFEFDTEDVKKKDSGIPYSIAAPEQNNLLLSGQVDLSKPLSISPPANGMTEERQINPSIEGTDLGVPSAKQKLNQRVSDLGKMYQSQYEKEMTPFIEEQQTNFQNSVDKKLKELQPLVDSGELSEAEANKQLDSFQEKQKVDFDKKLTEHQKKFETEFNKKIEPELSKWMDIYNKKFQEENFQENKETNPTKSLAKTAWSTFTEDLPSAFHASRALGGSIYKNFDQAVTGLLPEDAGLNLDNVGENVGKLILGESFKLDDKGLQSSLSFEQAENKAIVSDLQKAIELSEASAESKKYLINSLDKVKNGDWLDYLNYAASAAGQGVGQIPASIGTHGATSLIQEMGSIYLDSVKKISEETGLSLEEVISQGKDDVIFPILFGLGAGLLDAIGANKISGLVGKKEVLDSFRKRAIELGKATGFETVTEGSQSALEDFGIRRAVNKGTGKEESWYETLKKIDPQAIKEGALQGGIASLFLGGGGQITQKAISSIGAKKPTITKQVNGVEKKDQKVKPNEKPIEQSGKVDSKPLSEDIQKKGVQVQEKIKEEVQSEAENVKGQSKIDKALENISKKVKPQENNIPNAAEYKNVTEITDSELQSELESLDQTIKEREQKVRDSNTQILGNNMGIGTLTEQEFNRYDELKNEYGRRNPRKSQAEAKQEVAKKRAERVSKDVKKVKSFKTENGHFSVYDTDKEHTGRGDMFTVKEDKDGWIVQNALVPEKLQKQGISTEFYQKMNEASKKATGNPLRSTQPRKLLTGETVHELSEGGIKLWDSLVKKGVAEKLGEKDYRFVDKKQESISEENVALNMEFLQKGIGSSIIKKDDGYYYHKDKVLTKIPDQKRADKAFKESKQIARDVDEANEKAKSKGFDNASHALNSVKKRTGKEYKTVQEVPDKVLDSVANERGYDKLEAKAKELTESIDQLKSENPNEFKKDGSLKAKSKITGTYKALVDMRQGVYNQMQSGFEEEFKKRGREESEKSRIETEQINKDFEERANKDIDTEEKVFDEVNRIFGKINNEEQVTQEEVDYVNENAYLPKGFVFSETGLTKESGQKLSKKEEGKAKVAKGLEGLVSKIGATKNINPLDDTSVWEDVTNIIDGLADMGIAKTEEVIDYLKKEFKKLGIKEEDVESKRGDIALYVEDKNPVKAEPNEPTALETDKSNSRKKKLLNRAFEGTENTDIAKAIENHGLTYEPETWVHAKERAQAFVEEVGYENALDAVRKNQIEDGAAAFVWSEIIDSVGEQLAETTNSEDKARLVKIEAELIDEFDRKARSGGRFISALQDVYANSDFGYKLEVQVEQYKNRNNGVISPEVEAKFKELDAQLTEAKAKRVEAEERAKKAEDELSLQNIKDSIAREKKQNTRSAQKIREAKNERAKLKSEFLSKFNPAKSGGRLNATIPGAIFIEYGVKIANTFIKEGVARLEVVYAKTKEFFDKELGYTMSDQEASDLREKIKGRIQEIDEKEGKLKIPHSLIREYVEAGAKDVNELVSKIKEDIKETHPNVTDREIRDAITGYGKTTNPSQDEVEAQIRRMVRIGRLISKLEDVAQKKRPLRSGRQRDSLDAEERALNKELISEMKGLPVDAETEAQQIKTSLDAVKARIKNQIEELNLAIETGKSVARARGISYDEEAKQLEAERDQIKEVYDAIFYKRDDDATKIENILAATDRAIEATIKKIETNDLEAKKRGQINNPDVKAAKERLSRLRDRLEQLKEEAGIPERNRLDNTKARITKQISDLKDRLETKNFAKREKPTPIIRDSELLKLDAEIARIKEEYAKEQYKVELANRTTSQKWIDGIIEAWGLSRVFKATSEMSFIMIQGWVYTINAVRDPRTAIEGLKTAFSHFASQKRADDFMNQLRAQEYYPEMKAAKLSIAEADVKLTAREEGFISAWGNHLWNFVGYVVGAPLAIWKPAYKAFTAKWKAINPLSAIERANHAYMNTLRINKYLQGREMLRKQGKNFREHPQEYKNLADVINTFTGRASLGVFDRVAKPLAVVFFSPRNWASVIKTATPVAIYHFGGMGSKQKGETTSGLLLKGKVKPSVAQKLALMDYFTAIGVTTAMVMLIDAFSDDDDIEGVSVEKDPRSSDFMKIKIGDTRVDPWGGRIQMIVLQVRMLPTLLGGGYTKNTSGQLKRLGEGFTSTRGDLLGATVKNKLSPSAAIVWDLFNAKVRHYHGEEILTNKFGGPLLIEDPENNFSPIFWETVGELYEEHPTTVASYLTFLAFLGFGVSTYSKEDQRRKASELMEMKRKEIDAEK